MGFGGEVNTPGIAAAPNNPLRLNLINYAPKDITMPCLLAT